ncbi:MAG: hypothetical protein LBP92_01330 [Deltaproteobacteria bacterium]|jgi:hypothetical protein|nr:hypothetical protein [Deltaproteobacteria bacterium]
MTYGIHGQKLISALENKKLPASDKRGLEVAFKKYQSWIERINSVKGDNVQQLVDILVKELNIYKNFIDLDLIFDSVNNFLYR